MKWCQLAAAVVLTHGAIGCGDFDSSDEQAAADLWNTRSPGPGAGNGPRARTVFLNFEGAFVAPAQASDARHNLTQIVRTVAQVPPARMLMELLGPRR